jgi:hypothetical protein
MWTLSPLWTQRTRPQGCGNLAKNARFPQRPHRSIFFCEEAKNEDHTHSDQLSTESDQLQKAAGGVLGSAPVGARLLRRE